MAAKPSRELIAARSVLLLRSLLSELDRYPAARMYVASSPYFRKLVEQGRRIVADFDALDADDLAFCETCGANHAQGVHLGR